MTTVNANTVCALNGIRLGTGKNHATREFLILFAEDSRNISGFPLPIITVQVIDIFRDYTLSTLSAVAVTGAMGSQKCLLQIIPHSTYSRVFYEEYEEFYA